MNNLCNWKREIVKNALIETLFPIGHEFFNKNSIEGS